MRKQLCLILLSLFIGGISHADVKRKEAFNDKWEFVKTDCKVSEAFKNSSAKWQSVSVPHTWNDKDAQSGGKYYAGIGCYRKILTIPAEQKDKRFFLRFEGVGQVADVYVNGLHVGNHKGAYSAFCFEITDAVKVGEKNEVLVKADNSLRPDIIPVNHNLFMVFGGIYRPVALITTDKVNITPTDYASSGVYIKQEKVSKESARILVTSKLTNSHEEGQEITLKTVVRDRDGKTVAEASKEVMVKSIVETAFEQELTVQNPILWHGRRNPYLYSVTVELIQNGKTLDSVTQPLGLRFFRMDRDKGFILNGEEYRLYGVCRHQERKDYGSALSREQHQLDCDLMYEMGCTSLRLAHYQQSDDMYEIGDKMGFVIWAEIPFVNTWKSTEGDNAKLQMLEMVRQNYNHPSIVMWGLHNEVYARNSMQFPVQLTKELHNLAKSEDPDRFTVSASGFGSKRRYMDCHADLMGCNRYFGWYYGKSEDMGTWADNIRKVRPENPVCVSEYGCGGNVAHQDANPKQPAAAGQIFPEQYHSIQHEIQWEQLKPRPFIWGAYIWNMFDFVVPGWNRGGIKGLNHKGLITYDRKEKKDAFYFYKANWSEEPVLHLTGKRLKVHGLGKIEIKAYSNCEDVKLTVNGKVIKNGTVNSVNVYKWDNVKLVNGDNFVKITGTHNGIKLKDSCTFTFDADKRAGELAARKKLLTDQFDVAMASEEDKGHLAEHAADGDKSTIWSAANPGAWLRLDLNKQQKLNSLYIHWSKGNQRKYKFTISYSTDGNSWIEVYNGQSSGKVDGPEKFSFPEVETRYIRIVGMGSNATEWTNIVDVKIPEAN